MQILCLLLITFCIFQRNKTEYLTNTTNGNMRLDSFRQLYDSEREWKYKLDDVILVPIAILTGIGSIVSFIISNHPVESGIFGYIYLGFVILTFISVFLSLIFYTLSYINIRNWSKGYDYSHATPCNEINDYRKELINEGQTEDEADKGVEDFLIETFSDSRDDNLKINTQRAKKVGYGRLFLLIAVFFTFFLSIMFIFKTMKFQDINFAKKPKTTVKVNEGAVQDNKTLLTSHPKPKPDTGTKKP